MENIYSFGYWVMRRRKALDLTRAKLAKQVSCSPETIKKIERDERRPSRQTAGLMADALAIPDAVRERFLQSARGELSVDRLGLPSAPLQPFSAQYHNLPTQLTPFIGREAELAAIDQLLADPNCRLFTLIGPGGIGKSRLALKAAENKIGFYRHGIYHVPLAGVESADALPSAIANVLGLNFKVAVRSHLIQYLQWIEQELLLVLDNFEQLLDAAGLLVEILQNTQHLKFLVTSRERLKVQSEWVLSIEGLPFPGSEATEQVEQYAAVNLFVQTAQRVGVHFALNEAEKPAVVRICQLVEGMPLAIELAASWTSVISCDDIVHELEKDLDILATLRQDPLERHRSIRSVFDHSWKLLPDAERSALQRLSVFRGGFTRAAAEQVAGASLSALSSLVDKSLLSFNWQSNGAYRYNLHELIRQYAYERLFEEGETEVERTRERHLETFLGVAERAEPELNGPHNLLWLDLLERELDNLRVAFSWAREGEQANRGEKLQRMVGALWWFWCMRGHMEEACTWAECAISQDTADDAARAKVTWVAGFLHLYHGNLQPAHELLEQGVELCRRLGNAGKKDLALALNFMGVETSTRGDLAAAQIYHEESLAIRRELDDFWGIAQSLMNLGGLADTRGDFVTAQSLLEEGLAVSRTWGERSHIASLLNTLGWTVINQGDFDRARLLFHESLEVCLETRWLWKAAGVFESLARIEARQTETYRLIKAARLWGVAEMLFKVWGSLYHMEDSQAEIATIRDNLGESVFALAWAEGGRMTFDQALAYGLEA